jgi:hypothetical protein
MEWSKVGMVCGKLIIKLREAYHSVFYQNTYTYLDTLTDQILLNRFFHNVQSATDHIHMCYHRHIFLF